MLHDKPGHLGTGPAEEPVLRPEDSTYMPEADNYPRNSNYNPDYWRKR
jgi:hypothetical protein